MHFLPVGAQVAVVGLERETPFAPWEWARDAGRKVPLDTLATKHVLAPQLNRSDSIAAFRDIVVLVKAYGALLVRSKLS